MIARFSFAEVAAIIGAPVTSVGERAGCIGVSVSPDTIQSGALYFHLPGGEFSPQEAFQRGASLLVVPSGQALPEEMRPYTLEVPDPAESFWRVFREWRAGITSPVIASVGLCPATLWTEEFLALLLLTDRKGCFRRHPIKVKGEGSHFLESYELAAELMSGHEESFWYLVGVRREAERLLSELKPDLVIQGEGVSPMKDDLLYLGRGDFFYSDGEWALPAWPSPLIDTVRAFRRAGELAGQLEERFWGDSQQTSWSVARLSDVAKRIFFPPYLGFRVPLGEVGALWVERTREPSAQLVEEIQRGIPQGYTLAFVTELEVEALRECVLNHANSDPKLYYRTLENLPPPGQPFVLEQVIEELILRQPFFLIVFLSSDLEAERIFLNSHELYSLANRGSAEEDS